MFVYQFSKGKYKPTMIVIIRTFPSRSVVVCFDACKKEKNIGPTRFTLFSVMRGTFKATAISLLQKRLYETTILKRNIKYSYIK